ncbi:Uncharacterised protein [Bordetella pertussis]|nr:Uncharacterised protein [Bordetella pertussis]
MRITTSSTASVKASTQATRNSCTVVIMPSASWDR